MKKWTLAFLVTGLLSIVGIGGAWAASDSNPNDPRGWSFEQMLPFMKQMHPSVDEKVLEDMYNSCHGRGVGPGMMQGGPGGVVPQGWMMKSL